MIMTSDSELLTQYAQNGSEEAFADLVERHLPLVFSAALRQTAGDIHTAQDVAQTVFADLARKARSLCRHQFLAGWLYTSTRFAAAKANRTERRRYHRELQAQAMHQITTDSSSDLDWAAIRPALDQAMHQLKPADRDLILMRYFHNRQLATIAGSYGLSEDAIRKRVDRALDKLRTLLSRGGISNTAALAAALSTNAVQSAPTSLAATVTAASLASAAAGTGKTLALAALLTSSKLKLALGSAALLAALAAPVIIHNRLTATITAQDNLLRLQDDQVAALSAENQRLSNSLALTSDAPTDPTHLELLRLRGEVGVLRRQLQQRSDALAALARPPKPSEVEQYYLAHQTNFWQKESVHLSLITLKKPPTASLPELETLRQTATALQLRLAAGADFASEATLSSTDTQAKGGGDWGRVERGMLRKELDDVAFSLREGEISQVVECPESFWILSVTNRRPPGIRPLSEVQDRIWNELLNQQRTPQAQAQR